MSTLTINHTVSHKLEAGCLLVSNPMFNDSIFARSVIYIFEHNHEQTQGFILNLPTEHKASDGLDRSSLDTSLHNLPIHTGGPIDQDRLYFVSFFKKKRDNGTPPEQLYYECLVGITADQAADDICERHATVRCFSGRSTWGPEQIKEEIKHHFWLVIPTPEGILSWDQNESLWAKALQHTSPFHHLVSLSPKNIGNN